MAQVQGNMSASMQAGPGALPPGLTPQQVQDTFQKFRRMQEAKVPPTDPEYIKAHRLLSAVQQNQAFRKMREMQAQQRAQLPNQSQANVASQSPSANGVNGAPLKTDGPAPPSSVNGDAQPNGAVNANRTSQPPNTSFSPEQLFMLKSQIQAFRLLSRNMPIPPNIQKQLFPNKKLSVSQPDGASAPTPHQDVATVPQSDGAAEVIKAPKTWFNTYDSPYDLLAPSISFSDHAIRGKRPCIPALFPIGVDINEVREERERIVYNRIQARKAELAALPANITSWSMAKSDAPADDDSIKLKALIEFKKLSLLQKQRDFRREVARELFNHDNLAMTANRSLHRRLKKQSLREARITDKLEKQQRDARESKEKKKQTDHLQAIISHGFEIRKNAGEQLARQHKLGRMMISQHQNMEKEEQKRIERTAKQRLQALKANDEETYLKLLGQAKDSRISHLLRQTDGFLKQLAASVRQQQRIQAERYGGTPLPDEDEEEDEDEDDDGEGQGRIDYYAIAHRIKEEVNAQPNLLVGGTLKEYQLKGLQWMVSLYNNNLNGVLADEMGLGKTIQTISLITYLIEVKKQPGPYLVIVPLSTLTNWNLEFERWAPSIARVVYKGPPMARKQQQQRIRYGQFQVLLTTYEYIIKDRPVLSKIKWLHMIIDEGHRMKNAQSKLSSTLSQYYITRYRLILTGTPLQNNLTELWAILNFVLPTIFKSATSFDEWFNTPFANTGGQDKMELTEEEQLLVIRRLHKVLRPFLLRRLKKDVEKDLPDKQESVIKCRFSALQAKLYKQLMTHNKLAVADGKGGKTGMRGLSNMLMQLRKLCNHPFVFEAVEDQMNPGRYTNDSIWRTAGKFELLDRILPKFKATGHRVLMFFQMTQIMNIMEDFLRLRDMKYLRLDGSTKSDDRSDLLQLFNAPNSEYFCFLLSTRAGGLGLNLQTADTVIIYDSDWNPHQDLQAQDRAHRIGQKNEVRILRLISSNSVEEKILETAQFKLDMDGKVIQAGRFDNKSTNEERDAMLRTLLESAEAAEAAGDQEEMDDDDLNDLMARSEEEAILFAKMDQERIANDEYGPGRELPRLMAESELPEIYVSEENPVAEVPEEYAGRGARERKVMKYDDGLTEEQWLMAVDADDDTIEDAIARKEARIDKRRTNKEKRIRKAQGGDAESSPEPESEEEPQPKKRGRKTGGSSKRKAEEVIEEEPPKKKRGRQTKVQETLTVSERTALQKVVSKVYDTLEQLEVEDPEASPDSDDDDDGPIMRPVIPPFAVRPDRKLFPDYYQFIANPIAMDMIKKKIDTHFYQSVKEFQADVHLLCANARTYNEDGSLLFQDANLIQETCDKTLTTEVARYPQLDGGDGGSSMVDGQSTAAGSIAGTPAPPINGTGSTKLKLTFGGGGSRATSGAPTNGAASGAVSDAE